MKKILSLLVMLIAFCAVSFAQSAPKTATKATLMPKGILIKDGRTNKVIGVTNGTTKSKPATRERKATITKNGVVAPVNSNKSPMELKQLSGNVKVIKRLGQQ